MSNEIEMIRMLPQLLSTFGNPIRIIETGMHDGFHTAGIVQVLRQSGRPFTYLALEPDPRINAYIPHGVTFLPKAIGRADGQADFYLSSGVSTDGQRYIGSSSLHAPSELLLRTYPQMRFKHKITVDVVSYDTLCAHHGMDWVDFVWCDTQGCEGDLIAGGLKMMPKTKWFFTEYSDGELYLGQSLIEQVKEALPFMEVHTDWGGDILFKNRSVVLP